MLPAAEPDLDRQAGGTWRERGQGLGGGRAQPGQRLIEQALLPGAQSVAADAAIEALGGRFQRLKALRSAGTRSVVSQVKLSSDASGSRPKWPYAAVGT